MLTPKPKFLSTELIQQLNAIRNSRTMRVHGTRKACFFRTLLAALAFVFVFYAGPAACRAGTKCLWSIKSERNTVYLLGSIHLLSRRDYPLDEDFTAAYRNSPVLVFETDLAELDQPATQALMMQHGLLPKGHFIREVLSPRTYGLLERYLAAQGLDMARFEGLRPWVCAVTLTMLEMNQRGYLPQHGLDRTFYEQAVREGKKIIALETARDQLALFFELGKAEQDAFLQRTLNDLEKVDTLFPRMLALWKSGDIRQLDIIMQESFAGHPALYRKFLVRRNARWLPVIAGLIGQPDNALVIVGASHLGGADGLIRKLAARGFRAVQK